MVLPTSSETASGWRLRLAEMTDVEALNRLIALSVRGLQVRDYSSEQIEAALGTVFGVDRALIQDRTYFAVEAAGEMVACGGWSRRRALCGSDAMHAHAESKETLDPRSDAARIRAFFVHPQWARRGIGRALLAASEAAIAAAGFQRIELMATLTGEGLYAASGYTVVSRETISLAGGLQLPVTRMQRTWGC